MADLERDYVQKHLDKMKSNIANDQRDLQSTNFEIRRGAESFLRHHEFQAELARGYLDYLDRKA